MLSIIFGIFLTFRNYLIFLAESIIIQLCGIIAGASVFKGDFSTDLIWKSFALYIGIYICRFLSIYLFYPLLK